MSEREASRFVAVVAHISLSCLSDHFPFSLLRCACVSNLIQHVYTNGDICLDLLGKGWRPQITARSLAISILSMLSSAREKGLPPDNCNREPSPPHAPPLHPSGNVRASHVLAGVSLNTVARAPSPSTGAGLTWPSPPPAPLSLTLARVLRAPLPARWLLRVHSARQMRTTRRARRRSGGCTMTTTASS